MSRRETHIYLWHGSKSSEDSRATAKEAARKMLERYASGCVNNNMMANATPSLQTLLHVSASIPQQTSVVQTSLLRQIKTSVKQLS